MSTAQRSMVVNVGANVGPYVAGMGTATKATQGFATQARRVGPAGTMANVGARKAAGGAKQMAGTLGILNPALLGPAGLVYGMTKVVGAAVEWESAFAGVRKTVDGTDTQLAAISTGLREMSTQLPTSAEELAGIAESAGQLGIETDNVLGFTKVIADLGETTNLVGQEGATQLARFANITQMAQGDFDRLGATIVDLGNNSATTEAEIAEMGLRLAGAGAQIGLTEAQILGVSAALSSLGVRAESGGTAFSKVFIDIANAAASGGEELAAFAAVAEMAPSSFAAMVESSPDQAIVALVEGLGAASDRGENLFEVIESIGVKEIRMRDALLRSAGAGDLLAEAIETGNRAWEENNALTKEAEQRYETTGAKIDMVKNKAKEMARTMGEELKPLTDFALEDLSRAFDDDQVSIGRMIGGAFLGDFSEVQKLVDQELGRLAGITPALKRARDATAEFGDHMGRMPKTITEAGDAAEEAGEAVGGLAGSTSEASEAADEAAENWMDLAGRFLDANQAMERAQDENREAAEEAAEAHNAAIDKQIDALKSGETEQRKSLQAQKKNWEDFAAESVTIEQVTRHLEDINQEFRDWQGDVQDIAARAGGDVAERLAMMGPEWAPIVAQAVDATAEELAGLDAAMVENISLQMAAAEMAVQMQVMEEVARQGSEATVGSVAAALGAAPEVVERVFGAIGHPTVTVDADIDPLLAEFAETHDLANEIDTLVAIATFDANNESAVREFFAAHDLGNEWDEAFFEAGVQADVQDAIAEFMEANGLGDEWDARVAEAELKAAVDRQAFLSANDQLNDLARNRTATISVRTQQGRDIGAESALYGRASGGPVWPGQNFLVGEQGPEIVTFGSAGTVIPAPETARMRAGGDGASAGGQFTLQVYGNPDTETLRRAERQGRLADARRRSTQGAYG